MSSKAAMASIAARQQRELYLQEFSAAQAVESRQREAVNWEAKGRAKIIQRDLHRQLDKIQAQYRDTVVERRKRLVDLLQREQQSYDKMLECLTETDEQRRECLIRKAKELREKREADRIADLTNRNNRLFRDKIDCLRQAESRLRVMQVADARFQQLAQAKIQKAEEEQDEIYFAHQAAENCRLASERAQRDLEDRYLRTKRLKEDLSAQVEGNLMRQKIAAEEQKRETETFFQQLHEERVQEAQKQLARRDDREQMAAEMKALNEELERARKEEYDRLRQEDKELLDQILAEIAVEKQKSMEEKHARMMKEKAAYHDMKKQMSQHKEDEDALEKLWEEANQKEWEKREARWKADQTRRDQLMRNILIIRRQQVLDKHQQRREEAENRKQENAEIRAALARDDGTVAAEHQKRLDAMKENQRYLNAQISMRQAAKDAELAERRNALSSAEAMEACYHDRIKEEMANLEAAKPERYRHVPLLPPRQRDQPF